LGILQNIKAVLTEQLKAVRATILAHKGPAKGEALSSNGKEPVNVIFLYLSTELISLAQSATE